MRRLIAAVFVMLAASIAGCQSYDHAAYQRLLDAGALETADGACAGSASRCNDQCVDTATDPSNCGGCGIACPGVLNGRAACDAGTCGSSCAQGFHACGAGCVDDTQAANCGAACAPCATLANATTRCDGVACRYACVAGFGDCNGDLANAPSDGCETDLTTAAHCGGCATACGGTTAVCAPAATGSVCAAGCTGSEVLCSGTCVDTAGSVAHCGGCTPCRMIPNATPTCMSRACRYTCNAGFADSDGNLATDGCETATGSDVMHCGGCATPCPTVAHGTAACVAGACTPVCSSGYVALAGQCVDFAGAYDEATIAPCGGTMCLAPNPVTSACTCPTGFATLVADVQTFCGSMGGGAGLSFCQSLSLSTASSWAGAYVQVVSTSACNPGECTSPNSVTGGCSCPTGTTAIRMAARRTPGSCTTVDATLVVCTRPAAASASFLGAYELFDGTVVAAPCAAANPWTGACSCPAGARSASFALNATGGTPAAVHPAHAVFCFAP